MQKLEGKVALITGGNSGIGFATAKLFREHGAHIAITGRNEEGLENARQALGGDTLAMQSDTGNLAEIDSAMEQVRARFGRLDVLLVNAGASRPAPFELVSEEQFDEVSRTNFKGVFFTIQKALPLLAPNSSVIVTTSISNQKGSPNFSVYAACKAAQRSLVRTLSMELIQRGIRVNAVSPGPIATSTFGQRWGVPPDVIRAAKEDFERKSPMKRFGTPEEVARVALFLASDDSSYVVGEEIVVDGGASQPLL